jgi:hypothetical protein
MSTKTKNLILIGIGIFILMSICCCATVAIIFNNPSAQSGIEDQYCRKWRAAGANPSENIGFCSPMTQKQWDAIKAEKCTNPEDYDSTEDKLYYICNKDEERDKRNIVKGYCMAHEEAGGNPEDDYLGWCSDDLWKSF